MNSVYSITDSHKRKRDRKRKLKNSIVRLVCFSLTAITIYILLESSIPELYK